MPNEENTSANKENAEQKDAQKTDLEVNASQENISRVSEIKAKLSAEIEKVNASMNEISKMKEESIEIIELKKKELRELSGAVEVCKEKDETMKELQIAEKEIESRKISITLLDQTISNLDKQIAQIQSEHDKATGELNLKRRKLNAQLQYYDLLNMRLTDLLDMLQKEGTEHENKLKELLRQKSEILKRTDLSQTAMKKTLADLELQSRNIKKEHDILVNCITMKLSDMEISEPEIEKEIEIEVEKELDTTFESGDEDSQLLTEEQIQEVKKFETDVQMTLHPRISDAERLALLKLSAQITPSGRIITKDDRIISLQEARELILTDEETEDEGMSQTIIPEGKESEKFYVSTPSEVSSSEKSSSIESELDQRDIDYLKRVFGKSLSLALSEITAVQPSDPIHYLAHWFIKYRYNQEIDEVKRFEIAALMIEREKLEAERWHKELREEAYRAVLEALFRAENIIMQQDYERFLMMQEMEGEFDANEFNPMDFLTQ